jgi:hypothetical protein
MSERAVSHFYEADEAQRSELESRRTSFSVLHYRAAASAARHSISEFFKASRISDLLRYVDYLSTVSGGGYIGSWLLARLKEDGNNIKASPGQAVSEAFAGSGLEGLGTDSFSAGLQQLSHAGKGFPQCGHVGHRRHMASKHTADPIRAGSWH